MGEISDRRAYTIGRVGTLRDRLKDAEKIAAGKACVYATGSYGRYEASQHSDLDIFIVGRSSPATPSEINQERQRQLSRLNEVLIKAELINISRSEGFPEFSKDGKYVSYFSVDDFTQTLGTENDDVTNTFTARLLLLLESCALIGVDVYEEVARVVVEAYWRDFDDHKSNFMPAFLTNDILRLWRTFCVNYEARTAREPEREKAEGKMKNYKLKHSRIMTCYSAILYLLALYVQNKTVTQQDALEMFKFSPTQRIEWLIGQEHSKHAERTLATLLEQYETFLTVTSEGEEALISRFLNREEGYRLIDASKAFGNSVYKALSEIGAENPFYRMLVV